MTRQKRGNDKKILGILIIIALALILVEARSIGLLSFYQVSCSPVQGVSCASQINGAITSLSEVKTFSNQDGLSGTYWLVNMILNGEGQSLFSGSSQQIASAINSSAQVKNNNPVSIQAKLNYQHLVIPYYYSGTNLYAVGLIPIDFNFSWFSQGAGLLTIDSQTNQSANSNSYVFGVSGSYADADENQVLNAYTSDCSSHGGKTFGVKRAIGVFNEPVIEGFELSCYAVGRQSLAQIYSDGSPMVSENVGVIYSNSTSTETFNLTSTKPEESDGNLELAQIVGYETGSLNTFIGTQAPTIAVENETGAVVAIPHVSTATIQSFYDVPQSDFQSAGISIEGVAFNHIYNLNSLQKAIQEQNAQAESLLNESLNSGNAYYGGIIYGEYAEKQNNSGAYNGDPYYYSLNVTNNPILYPDIQMIVNAKTLGIYIPVASPYIIGYSPDPLKFKSGSAQTITFMVNNSANVQASAYIVVRAVNGTLVGQSPDFAIPANGKVEEPVIISAYNPDYANLVVQFNATVYSAENTNIHSSMIIGSLITPNCPSGTEYVNNTNCQSESVSPTACPSGYYYINKQCLPLCPSPEHYNSTTKICYAPTQQQGATSDTGLLIAIIIIVAIIASAAVLIGKNKGGASSTSGGIASSSHTFASGSSGYSAPRKPMNSKSLKYLLEAGLALFLFLYFAYIGFLADFIIILFVLGLIYMVAKLLIGKLNFG